MVTVGASGWVLSVLIQPMEQDLGWSRVQLVGVLALSSVLAGAGAARLGPIVDRHGTRLLQTVSAAVGGSCLVAVAFVTAPWQYYLCWAGVGLAVPGLMTLGPGVAIANWFIRRRALAFTLYSLGSATAGIVLAPLVAQIVERAGWRAGWLLLGVLLWCVAPLAWLIVRRRPEDLGLHPDGDTEVRANTADQGHRPRPAVTIDEPPWTRVP
jgi:MFS family permease